MKKSLLVLSALLAVSSAQANTAQTVFSAKSALPQELREKLISYIEAHCGEYVSPYGLSETGTTVDKTEDTGVQKYEYGTALTSTYYFDGMHPTTARIYAETYQLIAYDEIPYFGISHVSVEGTDCK
ncbi:MAG: hypothetical protein ACJ763_12570 [Bdellovibrionia bacterium]